ncbi:hypothetical protein LCGC14_1056540 [marine sediment metagenome]|uniref:LamG-like jellyroll fold domain-containing protein n=1 Tax=marine sediment metagenome TaxID=412755 RepID=A0A0F9MME5_9ZZZZ
MKKLILMLFVFVLLVGTINAVDFDDVKSYDSEKTTYTLTNFFGFGKNIATLELKTNQNLKVGRGYGKVAEIEITNGEFDYNNIINALELYNISGSMASVSRNVDYKFKTTRQVEYQKRTCVNETDLKTLQKTEVCTNEFNYYKDVEDWKPFTNNSLIKEETITIGIFTIVEKGDNVEWVLNVYGNERLEKWASWTDSMFTNLDMYYRFNETSGQVVGDVQGNFTGDFVNGLDSGWTINGLIDGAISFNGTVAFVNTTYDTNITLTQNWSISCWINSTAIGTDTMWGTNPPGHAAAGGNILTTDGDGTGGFTLLIRDDQNNQIAQAVPTNVNDGNWHNWILSRDTARDVWEVVIDGISRHNISDPMTDTIWLDGFPLGIGANTGIGTPNGFIDARIDECGIWSRSFTISEMVDLFNGGLGISPPITGFKIEVTLINPSNNTNSLNTSNTFGAQHNVTDGNLTNSTLFIWFENGTTFNTTFQTITGNVTNTTNITVFNFPFSDNYKWTYQTCADNSTSSLCNFPEDGNFTLNVIIFNESLVTFNPFTFETKSESFITNITTNGNIPNSATFVYNGTDKGSATITSLGNNNFNISKTIDIPTGSGNNSWIFNITFNSLIFSTVSEQQRVALINLTFCQTAPQNIPYLNFSFKNETTNKEDVTAFIDSSWTYHIGGGSVTKNLNYANATEAFNYDFCFNPPNQTLTAGVNISYNNAESQQRISNLLFSTLTNVTTQQTLFLLPTTLGLFSQFFTQDTLGNTLVSVLATITRTLVGSPITVTSDTTDGSGLVVFFLNPDVTYTATFSKSGFIDNIFTFVPITDLRTVTMGSVTDVVVNGSTISLGTSYEIQPDNSSLNNNTVITFSFNVTSGETITLISMNITNSTNQVGFQSNAGQGFISENINTDNNTKLFGEFIIQTANETITIKRIWFVGIEFVGDYSLFRQLTLFNDYGFDEFIKFLIVLSVIVGLLIFMSGENQIEDEIKMVVITLIVWGFSVVNWLDTGVAISSSSTSINALTQFSNQYGIAILTTAGTAYFILRRIFREI